MRPSHLPAHLVACLILALAFSACSKKSPNQTSPEHQTASDAGKPAVDNHPSLQISIQGKTSGTTNATSVESGQVASIDPTKILVVKTNLVFRNARFQVLDPEGQNIPSESESLQTSEGLQTTLTLGQSLKPGTKYTLVLGSPTGSMVMDEYGRPHKEQRFELETSGGPKKKPPPSGARPDAGKSMQAKPDAGHKK